MNRKLLIIIFFGLTTIASAQKDQENKTYYEEQKSDTTKSKIGNAWRSLINNDVDEKYLIKLDLIPYFNKGVAIGFERRIGLSSWSIYEYTEAYLDNLSLNARNNRFRTLNFKQRYKSNAVIGVDGGTRYYYNKIRRIRKGKNANSFSANYLGLNLGATINTRHFGINPYATTKVGLAHGIQRRLGKIGFIEWSVEAGYGNSWGQKQIIDNQIIIPTTSGQNAVLTSYHYKQTHSDYLYFRSTLRAGLAFR